MKNYYYLDGLNQVGPLTELDLLKSNLDPKTLVWSEGMPNWLTIEDLKGIIDVKNHSASPPLIPTQLIVGKDSARSQRTFLPSRRAFGWFIIWLSFHSFAMFMSYNGIDFFSTNSNPIASEFWPFVDYFREEGIPFYNSNNEIMGTMGSVKHFLGLFNNYDTTEFYFYIGQSLLLLILTITWPKKSRF